ncbi:MAG: DciA family protein [Robiginitomaculum sp.]|nr:DciA family protein [Robiginitomaculum sp.]
MNDLRNQDSLKARTLRGNTLAYLQKHRGRPQYRHAPKAGRAANKVLRPLSRKFGPGVSSLRSHWADVIGERWAQLSKPTAIRGSTGAKTLHIEAKGPAAAMLQADSASILNKVNQFLGAGAIAKIMVKQGRIRIQPETTPPPPQLYEKLETDDDGSLQAALDKLGSRLMSRPIIK